MYSVIIFCNIGTSVQKNFSLAVSKGKYVFDTPHRTVASHTTLFHQTASPSTSLDCKTPALNVIMPMASVFLVTTLSACTVRCERIKYGPFPIVGYRPSDLMLGSMSYRLASRLKPVLLLWSTARNDKKYDKMCRSRPSRDKIYWRTHGFTSCCCCFSFSQQAKQTSKKKGNLDFPPFSANMSHGKDQTKATECLQRADTAADHAQVLARSVVRSAFPAP